MPDLHTVTVYIWLHQVTCGYSGLQHMVMLGYVITVGYLWLCQVTCGHNGLHMITVDHMWLHIVILVYMWIHWVTYGYIKLHEGTVVTQGYILHIEA